MFIVVPVVELGRGEGGGGVHCYVEDAWHFGVGFDVVGRIMVKMGMN